MMILLFLITLPIILIYLLRKNKKTVKRSLPLGPRGLPLIGNLHQLVTATIPHIYLWQLSKIYGPIVHLRLGSAPVVVISSAKLAKEVLKTQDTAFCGRPKLVAQQKLSYNGVDIAFSQYSDHWREARKITATHLLSLKKVQSFRPVREDEVSRMVTKISRFASSRGVLNLSEIAMGLTSTLICRIGFGRRYEDQGSEQQRFDELLKEIGALMTTFFVSDYFPSLSWVDKLSGLIDQLDTTFKKLDSFYQELIDEHLHSRLVRCTEEEEDILGILIKLEQQRSGGPNWDHIKALLMNIFLGGTDTSAASIVWNMTVLMKAPNVMKKAQAEIRNLVGRKGRVDEDDLPKLPYLKAIINETFRLYTPVPVFVPREITERRTLEGYEIPPGTMVYINAWAVSRDPESWDNPHEFSPERFLNSDVNVKGQDFGVIPFGSGKRICPGMFMGIATVELAVANLLYSFDWELPPGIQAEDIHTEVLPGLIMHKKDPLLLVPRQYLVN